MSHGHGRQGALALALTSVLLTLAACMPEAPVLRTIGGSPQAKRFTLADVPVHGSQVVGYANVVRGVVLFRGELLAAEKERLVLSVRVEGGLHRFQVRYDQLVELTLVDQLDVQTGRHSLAFLGGALATPFANGLMTLFTGPIWVLGGTGVVISELLAGSTKVPPHHWNATVLRHYARFPAGLPSSWTP